MFKDLLLRGAYSHVSYMSSLTVLRLPSSPSWLALSQPVSASPGTAHCWQKGTGSNISYIHRTLCLTENLAQYKDLCHEKNPPLSWGHLQFYPVLEQWEWSFLNCVFVLRGSQLGLCTELYCCSFSAQCHHQLWWLLPFLTETEYNIANDKSVLMVLKWWFVARIPHHG